jgi:ribosomal protein L11 methyltransferase
MPHITLRFSIHREKADTLSTLLEELGALSVTWENAGDDDYLEAAYPHEPDWRHVHLTALFHRACQPEEIASRVNARLQENLSPSVETLEDQDWERVWLEHFEPRRYGANLWVCPTWIDPPDPGATNILLDPGLAFGTGDHATTALCLEWISEHEPADCTVMDYGCGSGILAIACLLKGATRAYGVDIDPRAVAASLGNAESNGVAEKYAAMSPVDLPQALQVDVVFANILAQVLVEQSAILTRATGPGGRMLLTGILEDQVDHVRAAFEPHFRFDVRGREQWRLLVGRKA